MMNYIHSTASQTMVYPVYAAGKQNQARILKEIRIKGTANVADPATLVTPQGVVTEVSDEDLALLKKNPHFQRHVEKGFIKFCDKANLDNSDMEKKDNSSQLRDEDYASGNDPRTPDSGNCYATCGRGDRIKGHKGVAFVDE